MFIWCEIDGTVKRRLRLAFTVYDDKTISLQFLRYTKKQKNILRANKINFFISTNHCVTDQSKYENDDTKYYWGRSYIVGDEWRVTAVILVQSEISTDNVRIIKWR